MDFLPQALIDELEAILILRNPKYKENEKYGYSNYKTSLFLEYREIKSNLYIMPRGFLTRLELLLQRYGIRYNIINNTRSGRGEAVQLDFTGKLKDFQRKAYQRILSEKFGILQAPTGSGKTVMGLSIIAQRKTHTIIIVHTKELLYQWRNRITEFLNISKKQIGLIGDGHKQTNKIITIAIVNSLYRIASKVSENIGFVIVDEAHRTPANTFSKAVSKFDSEFMLGLSATPFRRDGLTDAMHFFLGETVHAIGAKTLQDRGEMMTASLKVTKTGFNYVSGNIIQNDSTNHSQIISSMVKNVKRNKLIVQDIISQTQKDKGIALVISDRKKHCKFLYDRLSQEGIKVAMITGSTPDKERKNTVRELSSGAFRVLVATGQLIGEGFDLKSLSSIFLTTPIKYEKRVIQYVGRILRVHEEKSNATIYDYIDNPFIFWYSFKKRLKAYEELGIDTNIKW